MDVAGADLMQFAAFIEQVRDLRWLRGALFGWREVGLVVPWAGRRPRPFAVAVVLRLLSRGPCWIRDPGGGAVAVGPRLLAKLAVRLLVDGLARHRILAEVSRSVKELREWVDAGPRALALKPGPPVFLKTDLWLSAAAGGSVTHTAGVVNRLGEFFGPPLVFAPAPNPLLAATHEFHLILPDERHWDYLEMPALAFNARARRMVLEALAGRSPAFLYVRYGLNSFAGVALARDLGVPLVLEYNGSEIWVDRHWGRAPARGALAEEIEDLCLAAANLIVVVSDPLRRELRGRGVPDARILVNPNGVDPDVFRPDVDASALRASLGLEGRRVVGFIGTFGPWHGTELLVEAYARCRGAAPRVAGLDAASPHRRRRAPARDAGARGAARAAAGLRVRRPRAAERGSPVPGLLRPARGAHAAQRRRKRVLRLADQVVRIPRDGPAGGRLAPGADRRGDRARAHGLAGGSR